VLPETGTAFRMGKCENHNFLRPVEVDDVIGGIEKRRPFGSLDHRTSGPRRRDRPESTPARRRWQPRTQPRDRALLFVPLNRGSKLGGRRLGRAKTQSHLPRSSFSIRRLTSSHGSSSRVPASSACTRRLISASHAVAAPGSAGPSRLAKSSVASSARSERPRRKAFARTLSVALVMPHMIRQGWPPNNRLNLPVRPVTVRACARPAPGRPAG